MSVDVDALSRRVGELEERVWGVRNGNVVSRQQEEICKNVADFSTDFGNNLAGQDRINPLLKKINELESYLDPVFGDTLAQSDSVKKSIVLSHQHQIQKDSELVDEMKSLQANLDEGNVTKAPEVCAKLKSLTRIQLDEKEKAEALSSQTLELVEKYNNIVSALTEAFVQADAQITAAEEKSRATKASD